MDAATAFERVLAVTLDYTADNGTLLFVDGSSFSFPLGPLQLDATSSLARLHWAPNIGLVAETRRGDSVAFELPSPASPSPVDGRRIVYLDQNQWSLIARALRGDDRVAEPDAHAARRLVSLAADRKVILPAASSHHLETLKWTNPNLRYQLGVTILRYSRGWQMRHPVRVRHDELKTLFEGRPVQRQAPREPIFTLSSDAVHGPELAPMTVPRDFAPDMAFVHHALTSASTLIDLMLDGDPIQPGDVSGWVASNQQFATGLRRYDKQQRRRLVDHRIVSDLRPEIAFEAAAAGMTVGDLVEWIESRATRDLRGLPAIGLYGELLRGRLLDTKARWREGDLTDMVFLSCAAAYADFVVCERAMCNYLIQGERRLDITPNVYSKLSTAIPAIELAVAESHCPPDSDS